jgi:hypothetical protein
LKIKIKEKGMNKYFIAFAFTDKNSIPRFGSCFYTCEKNIEDVEKFNETVAQEIAKENNIEDVVIINYIAVRH